MLQPVWYDIDCLGLVYNVNAASLVVCAGKGMLSVCGTRGEAAAWLHSKDRRCGQKGRGSIYDNVAGMPHVMNTG